MDNGLAHHPEGVVMVIILQWPFSMLDYNIRVRGNNIIKTRLIETCNNYGKFHFPDLGTGSGHSFVE